MAPNSVIMDRDLQGELLCLYPSQPAACCDLPYSFWWGIGIAAVIRRSLVLLWPARFSGGTSNPAAALDAGFARHPALTFVHILPGALFLGLATLQFAPGFRQKHLQLHRWLGRILVITGLILGTSAPVMSFRMNIGGANETAATTLFAIVFLICLIEAYVFIRRRQVARHREWMIRAYGVASAWPGHGQSWACSSCSGGSLLTSSSESRSGWDLPPRF
jgi:uncharacterized membrane protein